MVQDTGWVQDAQALISSITYRISKYLKLNNNGSLTESCLCNS